MIYMRLVLVTQENPTALVGTRHGPLADRDNLGGYRDFPDWAYADFADVLVSEEA
jgi:hypothetical protein